MLLYCGCFFLLFLVEVSFYAFKEGVAEIVNKVRVAFFATVFHAGIAGIGVCLADFHTEQGGKPRYAPVDCYTRRAVCRGMNCSAELSYVGFCDFTPP